MKRFIIPAFFIVDTYDKDTAEKRAADVQVLANKALEGVVLLLDEGLKTKEISVNDNEELPHTLKGPY